MSRADASQIRYELLDRISGGGMGEVYRARARGPHGFEKLFAIKQLLRRHADDEVYIGRFITEAKIAVTLSHANIVQVFDFGLLDDMLFLVMELVDGPTVRDLVKAHAGTGLPLAVALQIAVELCKGLAYAHGRGVVHRDISPSNILLSRAGEVKIADFGVARVIDELSGQFDLVGKWGYMAPEQTLGGSADPRSDIFAVGVVIQELLTGRQVFRNRDDRFRRQLEHPPPPSLLRPDLPHALDLAVARAMAQEPARRPTADELLHALNEVCLAVKVMPTPMDVARAVEPIARPREAEAEVLDAALQGELAAAGVSASPERVTQASPCGPEIELSPAASAQATTIIARRGTDDTGLPLWASETVVRPPPSRRNHLRLAVAAVAVAVLAAGAMAVWELLAPSGAPATVARDSRAPAPVPDARLPDARPTGPGPDLRPAPRRVASPRERYGEIQLHVEPWAYVYFRGKKVGEAPLRGLRLPRGRHRLTLVNPVLKRRKQIWVTVPSARPYRVRLR